MGRCLLVVAPLIGASVAICATGPDAGSQLQFVGTWRARFQGKVFCTLEVEAGATMSGVLSGCSIDVNGDGDLLESDAPVHHNEPCSVSNLRVWDRTLSFEVRDASDVMKFELVLTGEGRAVLHFLESPIKVKPIRFDRE